MAQKFVNVILYPSIDFLGTEGIWFEMLEMKTCEINIVSFLKRKSLVGRKSK